MPTIDQMSQSLERALKDLGVTVDQDWLDRCIEIESATLGVRDRRQVVRQLEELAEELMPDVSSEDK